MKKFLLIIFATTLLLSTYAQDNPVEVTVEGPSLEGVPEGSDVVTENVEVEVAVAGPPEEGAAAPEEGGEAPQIIVETGEGVTEPAGEAAPEVIITEGSAEAAGEVPEAAEGVVSEGVITAVGEAVGVAEEESRMEGEVTITVESGTGTEGQTWTIGGTNSGSGSVNGQVTASDVVISGGSLVMIPTILLVLVGASLLVIQ